MAAYSSMLINQMIIFNSLFIIQETSRNILSILEWYFLHHILKCLSTDKIKSIEENSELFFQNYKV